MRSIRDVMARERTRDHGVITAILPGGAVRVATPWGPVEAVADGAGLVIGTPVAIEGGRARKRRRGGAPVFEL